MSAAKKTLTMRSFMAKKYKTFGFTGEWLDSFGDIERNARWLVYGDSGHGKTELVVQLTRYLASMAKVLYVSAEQGDKSSLQVSFKRNKMELYKSVQLAVNWTFLDVLEYLKKPRSADVVVLDSLDYLKFKADDYRLLDSLFPNKSFVIICWSEGKKPKSNTGKEIEYMADLKVHVKNYVAHPRGRYGGNIPYIIWPEKAAQFYPELVIL